MKGNTKSIILLFDIIGQVIPAAAASETDMRGMYFIRWIVHTKCFSFRLAVVIIPLHFLRIFIGANNNFVLIRLF